MILLRYNYRKGFIGFTPTEISSMASAGRKVAVIDGGVYDMTDYVTNNGSVFSPRSFRADSCAALPSSCRMGPSRRPT